ncbi:hypothetical protein RDABS01_004419 [Bienertia sinuspersici]
MGRGMGYLAMKNEQLQMTNLIDSDINELNLAIMALIHDASQMGGHLGFGNHFLKWLASFAAMGEFGRWIAFVAVVLRLFFHRHFPDWMEIPGSLILLVLVAPEVLAHTVKDSWMGVVVLLIIGCYLLQEHIRATGGLRNSFTQTHGLSNTIGLLLILAYPIWCMVIYMV